MKFVKATMLSAVLVTAGAMASVAAERGPTTGAVPPQIATNPGVPYYSTRAPGPKTSPNTWIQPNSPTTANPVSNAPSYSTKGFGPTPN